MQKPTSHAVLLLLLLQFGMFAVVPIAHAHAEAAALAAPLHISNDVDHGCATHLDDLCQLCRWSSRTPDPGTRAESQLHGPEERVANGNFVASYVVPTRVFCQLGPRAPPA